MKLPKKRVLSCLLFMGISSQAGIQTWGAEIPAEGSTELVSESNQVSHFVSAPLSKEEMMNELLDTLRDAFMGPLKEGTFNALRQTMPADEVEEIQKACEYAFAHLEDSVSKVIKKVYMHNVSTKEMKALREFYGQPEMVSFMKRYCMAAVKINDHIRYGIGYYNTKADPMPNNKLSKALKKQREGLLKCFENLKPDVEKYGRTIGSPWNGEISDDAWDAILKGEFTISMLDFARVDYSQPHPQPQFNLRGLMQPFKFQDQQVKNICDHVIAKMYKDTVGDYHEGISIYDNFMKKYGKKTKALDEKVSLEVQTTVMPLLSEKMDEYYEQESS